MGVTDSMPQATRELASAMTSIDNIAQVKNHNGSIGAVDFTVHRDKALSERKIEKVMPEGWTYELVITPGASTSIYISKQ